MRTVLFVPPDPTAVAECEKGCPFWRPIHNHTHKDQNTAHCCHYLLLVGQPHPEVCDVEKLIAEYGEQKAA